MFVNFCAIALSGVGFLAIALLAAASILLVIDIYRHVRDFGL